MVKINIGCGKDIREGYINVDLFNYPGVDKIVDLTAFPWDFPDGEADEVYTSHCIEHVLDQKSFLMECYRILKPGGELIIKAPHVTSVTSQGNLGHYRGYCYDTFKDYLSQDYYMFEKARFRTIHQEIVWFRMEWIMVNKVPRWFRFILKPTSGILNFLINLSPRLFENLWCYWIGGAREVEWRGIKIREES